MGKKAFEFNRDSIYVVDPNEVAIIGGQAMVAAEQGPLDTAHKEGEHELYDVRILDVITEAEIANTDAFGVIEGITIRKEGDLAVVVDGRRRIRRARIVNDRRAARGDAPLKVRAAVSKNKDAMGVMIAANEIRQDDTVLVKLSKLKAYMARGVSAEDAAVTFGLSKAYVDQLVMFDEVATDELKALAETGGISIRAAAELARIKDPDQQREAIAKYRVIQADTTRGKRTGTLRAAQAARAETTGTTGGKPAKPAKAGKPGKAPKAAEKPAKDEKDDRGGKPGQGGLVPTKRELSALVRSLVEASTVETEAAVLLAEVAEGKRKFSVELDVSHLDGARTLGIIEGIRLALGQCEDRELVKMLRKATSKG